MFSCHLLPGVGRIFSHCFGLSCFFCIVLPFVNISLIFLLLSVLSGLFSQVVFSFFRVLPFPFCSYVFQRLSFVLSFWPVFIDFFISVFSQISHPGFDFFLLLFEGNPIFSQTNFAPAEIRSFNSVILFIDIYHNTAFILFVSFLTVIHSMFLNDSKVVFSLFIILFKFSRFTFCSCDSACSRLFGCVVFPSSEVGGSFRLGSFSLLIPDVSGTVLLSCSLFIFWCIFSISRSENQPFFIIVLT